MYLYPSSYTKVVVVVVVFFIYRGHKQLIQCFTMSQATIRLYRSPLDFHSVAAKAVSCWLRVLLANVFIVSAYYMSGAKLNLSIHTYNITWSASQVKH